MKDILQQIQSLKEDFMNLIEVEGLGQPASDVPPSTNKIKKDKKTKNGKVELVSVEDELFPYDGNKREQYRQKIIDTINGMIQGTATLEDLLQIVRQKKAPLKEAMEILEVYINKNYASKENPVVKITDTNYEGVGGKRLAGPFNKNHVGQYIVYNKGTDASYLVTPDNWKKSKIKKELEAKGKTFEALKEAMEVMYSLVEATPLETKRRIADKFKDKAMNLYNKAAEEDMENSKKKAELHKRIHKQGGDVPAFAEDKIEDFSDKPGVRKEQEEYNKLVDSGKKSGEKVHKMNNFVNLVNYYKTPKTNEALGKALSLIEELINEKSYVFPKKAVEDGNKNYLEADKNKIQATRLAKKGFKKLNKKASELKKAGIDPDVDVEPGVSYGHGLKKEYKQALKTADNLHKAQRQADKKLSDETHKQVMLRANGLKGVTIRQPQVVSSKKGDSINFKTALVTNEKLEEALELLEGLFVNDGRKDFFWNDIAGRSDTPVSAASNVLKNKLNKAYKGTQKKMPVKEGLDKFEIAMGILEEMINEVSDKYIEGKREKAKIKRDKAIVRHAQTMTNDNREGDPKLKDERQKLIDRLDKFDEKVKKYRELKREGKIKPCENSKEEK